MENILSPDEFDYSNPMINDEEIPVVISEPETTEVIPSIEPVEVVPELQPETTETPKECCCKCCDENITIGKYFGTLMESVKIAWEYHLKANKHSIHTILEEYYDDAQELVDLLIEDYQGLYGIVDNYENCICNCDKTPITYFNELRTFVESKRHEINELQNSSELMSDTDSILTKINTTIYKLTNLTENKFLSFEQFVSLQ